MPHQDCLLRHSTRVTRGRSTRRKLRVPLHHPVGAGQRQQLPLCQGACTRRLRSPPSKQKNVRKPRGEQTTRASSWPGKVDCQSPRRLAGERQQRGGTRRVCVPPCSSCKPSRKCCSTPQWALGSGHCGQSGKQDVCTVLMLTVSYPILSLNHSDLWYTFCTACCHVKTNLSRGVECLCKEVGQKSFKLHHANTTGVEWLCKRPARSSNRVVGCKLLTIKTLFSL